MLSVSILPEYRMNIGLILLRIGHIFAGVFGVGGGILPSAAGTWVDSVGTVVGNPTVIRQLYLPAITK
jgi:hypothetical protein